MNCSYRKWLADDAAKVPTGDYYCTVPSRGREKGEFGEEADYFLCNCPNPLECIYFPQKEKNKLEKLTEKN